MLLFIRYKEVQEQRFWQERLGTRDVDELGIDTNASFLADAVQPLPPGLAAPAPAPQPKAPAVPQHVQKSGPPAGASGRAGGIKEKEGGIPIIIVPSGCVPALAAQSAAPGNCCGIYLLTLASRYRMGSQVLLNMFNAKPFFEDCAFIPWEQQKSVRAQWLRVEAACATQHVAYGAVHAAGGRAQGSDARD